MRKNRNLKRISMFLLFLLLLESFAVQNSLAIGTFKSSKAQQFNKSFSSVNGEYKFDFVLLPAALLVVAAGVVCAGVAFAAGVLNCVNGGQTLNSTQMQLASMSYNSTDFSSFD